MDWLFIVFLVLFLVEVGYNCFLRYSLHKVNENYQSVSQIANEYECLLNKKTIMFNMSMLKHCAIINDYESFTFFMQQLHMEGVDNSIIEDSKKLDEFLSYISRPNVIVKSNYGKYPLYLIEELDEKQQKQ